jgi:hypothetical protein
VHFSKYRKCYTKGFLLLHTLPNRQPLIGTPYGCATSEDVRSNQQRLENNSSTRTRSKIVLHGRISVSMCAQCAQLLVHGRTHPPSRETGHSGTQCADWLERTYVPRFLPLAQARTGLPSFYIQHPLFSMMPLIILTATAST